MSTDDALRLLSNGSVPEMTCRRAQILWHLMPLADVAERLRVDYDRLIQAHRRGKIARSVRWIADRGMDKRTPEAQSVTVKSVLRITWK